MQDMDFAHGVDTHLSALPSAYPSGMDLGTGDALTSDEELRYEEKSSGSEDLGNCGSEDEESV